jgi:hypothetical protein
VLAAPFEPTLRRRQSSAMIMAWASAYLISTGSFNVQRALGVMCVTWRFAHACSPFSQLATHSHGLDCHDTGTHSDPRPIRALTEPYVSTPSPPPHIPSSHRRNLRTCWAQRGADISWGFLERLEGMMPPAPPPPLGPEPSPDPGPSLALARVSRLAVSRVVGVTITTIIIIILITIITNNSNIHDNTSSCSRSTHIILTSDFGPSFVPARGCELAVIRAGAFPVRTGQHRILSSLTAVTPWMLTLPAPPLLRRGESRWCACRCMGPSTTR